MTKKRKIQPRRTRTSTQHYPIFPFGEREPRADLFAGHLFIALPIRLARNPNMKFNALAFLAVATAPAAAFQPATPLPAVATSGSTSLNMVLEKPKTLSKLEILKTQSEHLENPLREVCGMSRIDLTVCMLFAEFGAYGFGGNGSALAYVRPTKCRWKAKFWKINTSDVFITILRADMREYRCSKLTLELPDNPGTLCASFHERTRACAKPDARRSQPIQPMSIASK